MEIIHFLDDLGQPYSCTQWGNAGSNGIPPIVDDGTNNTIFNWFNNPNGTGIYPLIIFIDYTMKIINIMGSSPSQTMANIQIEAMLENLLPGCMNETACNYNSDATADNGSCADLDCAGVCAGPGVINASGDGECCVTGIIDCTNVCDGTALDVNDNGICDNLTISQISSYLPAEFAISQNYPNPFNPVLNISFDMSWSGFSQVNVLDIAGAQIETLHSGFLFAGNHEVSWNAEAMPSGVYFISLKSGDQFVTEKVVLLK